MSHHPFMGKQGSVLQPLRKWGQKFLPFLRFDPIQRYSHAAPCDCSDFARALPDPPSVLQLHHLLLLQSASVAPSQESAHNAPLRTPSHSSESGEAGSPSPHTVVLTAAARRAVHLQPLKKEAEAATACAAPPSCSAKERGSGDLKQENEIIQRKRGKGEACLEENPLTSSYKVHRKASTRSPSWISALERELADGALFDLAYRCGAEGRCACTAHNSPAEAAPPTPTCRFPSCFVMRPLIKGAEVWAARRELEVPLLLPRAAWKEHQATHTDTDVPPTALMSEKTHGPLGEARLTSRSSSTPEWTASSFHIIASDTVRKWVEEVDDKASPKDSMDHVIQEIQRVTETQWNLFLNGYTALPEKASAASTSSASNALAWQANQSEVHSSEEGIAPATTLRSQQQYHIPWNASSAVSASVAPRDPTPARHRAAFSTSLATPASETEVQCRAETTSPPLEPFAFGLQLCQEIERLYRWRAALLVNRRQDEKAVNGVLNMANTLHPASVTMTRTGAHTQGLFYWFVSLRQLYETAAKWAVLNDMEIIVYRSISKQFPPFPLAHEFAHNRPLLLSRVFEQVDRVAQRHQKSAQSACDQATAASPLHELMQRCTEIVLQKEITALITRLQVSQENPISSSPSVPDPTEDPKSSLCVPLTLMYYRFMVHPTFWKTFFTLLCLPPLPAVTNSKTGLGLKDAQENTSQQLTSEKTADLLEASHCSSSRSVSNTSSDQPSRDKENASQQSLMPSHVLDAVGRSLLLHHLIIFAETRLQEITSGAVAKRVESILKAQNRNVEGARAPQPTDYDVVLEPRDINIAKSRLAELLQLIQDHEATVGSIALPSIITAQETLTK